MATKTIYEQLVHDIMRDFKADGVMVIVVGGEGGTGSSWGASDGAYIAMRANLPGILRSMADAIEKNNKLNEEEKTAAGGTN